MRRLIVFVLLAVGASAPAAGVSAQTPPASMELRLLEAPSSRRDDPRASMYIIDHLHPGQSISRRLGVVNRSSKPVRIQLYSGAAELTGGEFVPTAGGNDLASWTTISPATIDVPSFDEVDAVLRIDVPRDASSGERYGVAWAQLPRSSPSGNGTSEVNRVGIRMYLSVGPGGDPASDFVIDSLVAKRLQDGTPIVVARVRNTGGRALDMTGSLRLTNGPGSLSAGPFLAKLGTTLGVGQAEPVTVALDKQLPDGPWDARIDLRSGLIARSASATIDFPHGAGIAAPVKATPARSVSWTIELTALGALFLLVAVLLMWLLRRRRQEARRPRARRPLERATV